MGTRGGAQNDWGCLVVMNGGFGAEGIVWSASWWREGNCTTSSRERGCVAALITLRPAHRLIPHDRQSACITAELLPGCAWLRECHRRRRASPAALLAALFAATAAAAAAILLIQVIQQAV
jgi:hypothetical protein